MRPWTRGSHAQLSKLSEQGAAVTFIEKPLGSLAVSAEPLSPPTVLNLMSILVFLPTVSNIIALQYFLATSVVTSKKPKAPPPLACTTRSGMRSRSKAAM
eukprot:20890-Heterococcus_DN1.PRE.1